MQVCFLAYNIKNKNAPKYKIGGIFMIELF
ncbi:hypothetical protein FHT21_001843 [Pedobacter sp. SG908]|nr:hypothetical protein [Pedobacter sp. SG908]NMN36816.1 hypothetical protein [Pedobacter sp. SG918]